jgi:hypothetical protein
MLLALLAVATPQVRGPWLLVTLPDVGTLTWRCEPRGQPAMGKGLPALALAFRARPSSATETVTFRAGSRRIVKVLQPGQSVRFPYLAEPVQHVDVEQAIEPGRLVAHVEVAFVSPFVVGYCEPYAPPKLTVRVLPRR